jgi:hypothetical protein
LKKVLPLLKQQLKRFFSDLELENEMNWEIMNEQEKSQVIRKDVRLIDGLDLLKLTKPLEIWKCVPTGLEIQALAKGLPSASSSSSSSSSASSILSSALSTSSTWPHNLLNTNLIGGAPSP